MQRQKKKLTFKKYLARRTTKRIGRKMLNGNDEIYAKCEYYDQVYTAPGNVNYLFNSSSANFCTVAAMLTNSVSFQDNITVYSRYKICGLSLRVSKIVPDGIITSSFQVLPTFHVAFYPQAGGVDLGAAPSYNDQKGTFDSCVSTPQTKYWKFKDGFFEASAGGFGTWNNMTSYSSILGQLSLSNPSACETLSGGEPFDLRVTLYIKLSTRNR